MNPNNEGYSYRIENGRPGAFIGIVEDMDAFNKLYEYDLDVITYWKDITSSRYINEIFCKSSFARLLVPPAIEFLFNAYKRKSMAGGNFSHHVSWNVVSIKECSNDLEVFRNTVHYTHLESDPRIKAITIGANPVMFVVHHLDIARFFISLDGAMAYQEVCDLIDRMGKEAEKKVKDILYPQFRNHMLNGSGRELSFGDVIYTCAECGAALLSGTYKCFLCGKARGVVGLLLK